MRFKTGFVVGCATGYYLTHKGRRLRVPLTSRTTLVTAAEWPRLPDPSSSSLSLSGEKLRALGDLVLERATDLLRSPAGELARDRALARLEEKFASSRAVLARSR